MARQQFKWSAPRRDGSGSAASEVRLPKPANAIPCPDWLHVALDDKQWKRIDNTRRFHHQRPRYRLKKHSESDAEYKIYRLIQKTQPIVDAARIHTDLFEVVLSARERYVSEEARRIRAAARPSWAERVNPFPESIDQLEWLLLMNATVERLGLSEEQWTSMSWYHQKFKLVDAWKTLAECMPPPAHRSLEVRLKLAIKRSGA